MSGSFLEVPKSVFNTATPIAASSLGRTRLSVGTSPITGLMQDRYQQLMQEFNEIDKDGDKQLTFEEIFEFLSRRQGSDFDENLCHELFAKMDKNHDSIVTTQEFLWSYVDAEDIIMKRIKELKKQIQDKAKQMEECKKKMVQARAVEQMNQYGIMKGSVLTVNVIAGQDLIPMDTNGASDPYVILECDGMTAQTRYIEAELNPKWDEEFTFNVQKPDAELKITVMDHDTIGKDDFEGEVMIPLSLLKDQMKHDQFFQLHDKNPKDKWQGRVHLGLQWIWSRAKYLEDLVNQWVEHIAMDKEEITSLEEQLEKLRKPFGNLLNANDWIMSPGESRPQSPNIEAVIGERVTAQVDLMTGGLIGKMAEKSHASIIAISIFIFISILASFEKPDFFNLTIGLAGAYYWLINEESSERYRKLAIAIAASELLDLMWFWTNSSWEAPENPDGGIKYWTVYLAWIEFLVKIPVCLIFFKKSL